jgi:GNAT superfamily N-acetyltransferase
MYGTLEIEPLVVTKNFRKRGIGTLLAETFISEAQKIGTSLSVRPVARNVEAVLFFHDLGFQNLGDVELFIDFRNRSWKTGMELHGRKFKY